MPLTTEPPRFPHGGDGFECPAVIRLKIITISPVASSRRTKARWIMCGGEIHVGIVRDKTITVYGCSLLDRLSA